MKTTATSSLPLPTPATSFRLFLRAELARRCTANPQYSLRAFAARLEVDHSTLSQILRGRRPATEPTIRRLGRRLDLGDEAIDRFVANEQWFRTADEARARTVQQLTRDAANAIADWYHYAILELLRLEEFRTDSRWIARVLGITTDEVNVALQRLIHLRLLEMRAPDRWVDTSGDVAADLEDFNRDTVQRLAEQVRELSVDAVRNVPTAYRDHSSTTIAIDTRRLPEAIERLSRFRQEMIELLDAGERRDDVYRLEITFFPLTRIRRDHQE